jgi:glutaminase
MNTTTKTLGPVQLQQMLDEISEEVVPLLELGQQPDFIPELKNVPKAQFGIALALTNGTVIESGVARKAFSIQSISKVFALLLALDTHGEAVWEHVGREPSGRPFNDIALLNDSGSLPANPFTNAGALVVTDLLCRAFEKPVEKLSTYIESLGTVGSSIAVDQTIANSEFTVAGRNLAMTYLLNNYGHVKNNPTAVVRAYCDQCAFAMSSTQLALSLLPLAEADSTKIISCHRRAVNALMMTCGTYDAAGDFAVRIGLPIKSGSGGGMAAVIPGLGAICAWAPGLDLKFNSIAAARAIELFVLRAKIDCWTSSAVA